MRLDEVLAQAGLAVPEGADPGTPVTAAAQDSRLTGPGSIFVAIPGLHADGRAFAVEAVDRGAVAIVAEQPIAAMPAGGVPVVIATDSRRALSALAAALAGHPSRRLNVAGITGTDGKTITATMLWAAWRGAGLPAASLTTVDFRCREEISPNRTRQTTLDAVDIQERLRSLAASGCTHVALETSSHALELQRVADVAYRAAIYTRITSEHLELHGTRERYLAAKARLLEAVGTRSDGIAVLDRDDNFAHPVLAAMPVARRLTYSAAGDPAADLVAEDVRDTPEGLSLIAATPWGRTPLRLRLAGRFNAANALAALAAAAATGASLEGAVAGLESLERVSGRMERVDVGQPFSVIIDYAHTAEALDTVLQELRGGTSRLLWVIFGSAGDRDRSKRPQMGRVAGARADRIVITDEDPREEDPVRILEEIAAGVPAAHHRGESVFLIPDRAAAIRFSIEHAGPGDTILLAGKGHESSMIVGRELRPWDERAVAEGALRRQLSQPPSG